MYPRIVVTVDMIATGTDVRPLECLLFMRSVKSRTYFEQMVGRGVRVIDDTEFQSVTDDAKRKDGFVIVDAVGVMDSPLAETVQPLERAPHLGLRDLLNQVAFGNRDPQVASTVAARLARLDKHLTRDDRAMLTGLAGGTDLGTITRNLVTALDPDQQLAETRIAGRSEDDPAAVAETAAAMIARALEPLAANPELRNAILDVRKSYEQTIDETSKDEVLFAGHSAEARDRASALVASFRQYIEEHKDEIRALQVLYSRPYSERLTFREIKELAAAIAAAAAPVDPGHPLARLRTARQVEGARLRATHAHRHRRAGTVHVASGRRARPVPRPGRGTLRRMAARTGAEGGLFHRGTAPVADLDEGQHRRRTRHHPRVLRLHPLRRARRHRQGRPGLRRQLDAPDDRTDRGARSMSDLPDGWAWTDAATVAEVQEGEFRSSPSAARSLTDIRFLGLPMS